LWIGVESKQPGHLPKQEKRSIIQESHFPAQYNKYLLY